MKAAATNTFNTIFRTAGQLKAEGWIQPDVLLAATLPARHGLLPFAFTLDLMRAATCAPGDPVLRQFLPDSRELIAVPGESADPLGEGQHGELPRLIHQYPNRVLIRANSECAAYCRFCYRRSLLHEKRGFISDSELADIGSYLKRKVDSVQEVLLSGGDPLFASYGRVEKLLTAIRASLPAALIRICTRVPLVSPQSVTPALLDILSRHEPVVLVLHCNHPQELSPPVRELLQAIKKRGLSMVSQTVLLRGINDSSAVLAGLFNRLTSLAVQPYYLFQGDLALGTAHFRVPLSRGLEIYSELRRTLSGLALPRYAVDAPDGKGKMYLPEDIVGRVEGGWLLRNAFGKEAVYPEERAEH